MNGGGVPMMIPGATKLTSVPSSGTRYDGRGMLSRLFFPQSPASREMAVFLVVGAILSWLGSELRHLRWEALELATQRNEILESITDGFVALDANGRFVYLNSVAGQLTKGPRDEAIGKCLWGE